MKKFNALLFAMALVAVVAFASVAFAATQFLGVDTNGKVVVINVDPTKTSQKVTYEGYTITGAPKIGDDEHSTVKAFGYEGGIVVVSTDALNNGAKVYTFKTNDSGNFEYGKVYTELASKGKLSGDIMGVVTMQGNPVILATKAIATISSDKLSAIAISDDIPFVYNSNLYIVSADGKDGAGKIFEFKGVNDAEGAVVNSTSTTIVSREIVCPTGGTVLTNADVSTVTIDNTIYIAAARATGAGGSFDKIVIPTGSANFMDTSAFKITPVDVLSDGNYFALFNKDGALYALEKRSDNDLYLVEMTIASSKVTKTTILEKLSADVKGANDGTGSFDIYITDDVIGVINHGHAFAVFTQSENGGWSFVESKDFKTAAMVTTASTTPDTPVTPTTTVVDASTLAKASQDNLVAATPASAIADFVTAEEASTTTVPTGAQAAIEAELKKDDKTTVTLAAKTNYTPAKDGYILVKEAVDVSKVTVYFVEAATTTTTAATGDATKATLLDADCKEMGSTGTSVYAASGELKSGKTYTLVEATVSSTSGGDDEGEGGSTTSSSSGGCDAGFAAVSALLALAFFKKSRSNTKCLS